MRILLIFIMFISNSLCIFAQNLVPNPSFEEYSFCPDGISQIDSTIGWTHFRPTVDYFHACSNYPNISVPYQVASFQCAASGNAFCGLWSYNSTLSNLREYVGRQLSNPLIPGQKYYINFKVNLGGGAKCGCNNIGVLFTTIPYSNTNWLPIANFAHISTSIIIIDTINWVNIFGSFIADSAYEYIAIGNFYDDINTDTINLNTSNICLTYYFIDDVCVSIDSLTCVNNKEQIINFSADSTVIQAGSCINFNISTVVDYDFYAWQFPGAIPKTSTDSIPTNICYDTQGTYSVILIASDSSGCRDTITKTDYITVQSNTVINENKLRKRIEIYPVPAKDYLFIGYENNKNINVKIYNLLGELVYEKEKSTVNKNKIDLSDLYNGIYFVKLQTDNKIITRKIIIN